LRLIRKISKLHVACSTPPGKMNLIGNCACAPAISTGSNWMSIRNIFPAIYSRASADVDGETT
jgi:hypothetical protein